MHSRVYFWYHYVMNNFRKYYAFHIHFCSWTPAGGASTVGARSPLENIMCGGFPPCGVFFLCGKCLGLSSLEQISEGSHAIHARVVSNNNVALTEFEKNCKS